MSVSCLLDLDSSKLSFRLNLVKSVMLKFRFFCIFPQKCPLYSRNREFYNLLSSDVVNLIVTHVSFSYNLLPNRLDNICDQLAKASYHVAKGSYQVTKGSYQQAEGAKVELPTNLPMLATLQLQLGTFQLLLFTY